MNNILISIALLTGFAIFFSIYLVFKSNRSQAGIDSYIKEQNSVNLREIIFRDNEIRVLQTKINDLQELNTRYLSFMFKIPKIVQYLNTIMKFDEIITSIIELIKNIITTDHVEIYTFDTSDMLLKRVQIEGVEEGPVSYTLGEGLIGKAGKDRIVRIDGYFNKTVKNQKNLYQSGSKIWMAVPIIIKDRLLGVIGIGKVEKIEGNESNLMRMIADIAGVALINQALLGDANQKANTDSLTGLSNRNYFFQMAQILIEKAIKEDSPISIFLFDIDNFKHYNDNHGHDAGDKLLIELSSLVSGITRKNAILSRYGGEEFIVMLPGILKEDAFIYADRVREKIYTHPFLNRESQPLGCISISGGVASFPDDEDSLYKVIQLADIALYQAKSEGKNKVILYKQKTSFDQDIRGIVHEGQESSTFK